VMLLAPLGGFITWSRTRNAVRDRESPALIERPYSRESQAVGAVREAQARQRAASRNDRPAFFVQSPGQPDLALFAAISLSLGLIGNILFLRLLNYYMQPWYFLCLMAVVAAGADAAQRAASIGKGFRIFGVALVAVALMLISFSPLQMWSMTRRTNLDEVAHVVEQSATKRDYIVVTDWVQGITFHRYYGGSTPWQTLPALPADAHEIHRSDLVSKLMHRSDAISPVLDSVAQTLRDGHRVFYIGHLPEQLPSENPYIYFGKRVEQHLQPLPLEVWRYELDYTLHEFASDVTHIPINLKQPISSFEDLELSVFEGRRPSTIQSTAN
jgi:hypothetical protein